MIGISGCLGGIACRYDGKSQSHPDLIKLIKSGQAITFCPEVEGGLSIPRDPAEIIGGDGFAVWRNEAKVMTINGEDVTASYKGGTKKAYQRLRELGINVLILKEKSPSCGSQLIYDGSFSGKTLASVGVATAYFLNQGLKVYADTQWEEVRKELYQRGIIFK